MYFMKQQKFSALKPKTVLGIAAHPDDLDFTAAGTMALFSNQGAKLYYLILTDGSKGSDNLNAISKELVKVRENEQRQAAKAVGTADIKFLGYPDGALQVTLDLKKEIVKVIRSVKPDVVITMDPSMLYSAERGYINHPDHRAAGQAALDAVFPLARDHLTFPELFKEGYKPHKTKTILLSNFEHTNYYVDITTTFKQKIAALEAHVSQFEDIESIKTLIKNISRTTGKVAGFKMAEAFVRIDIN
jgi:LmbE family N-acetylglucosaminyl deacetylase